MLLLAAACAAPAPTPPPTPALVRLLVTDLTEPLGWDLALAYAKAQPSVVVVPQLAPAGNLAAELIAGRAEFSTLPLATTASTTAFMNSARVGKSWTRKVTRCSVSLNL